MTAHHWSSTVAMATPVAHKGTTQAAKVEAMTILDFPLRSELVRQARDYFQSKYASYLEQLGIAYAPAP
jgi:aminobenzoyl-glutamate utilization protein B